ncbi:TPA: restriction endonuclease subunit S [Citrobacter freundii]|uniref:Restriction endonuclease subunit S n=1 Tax=Klebsiella michiganensis TaxID=1134687 RepID=A0AAJ1NTH1_9ENTR|nr:MULTISPECIES: restriction endonuclease subunit S [Gammaproteobacteria]HCB1586713.1 restriction endonuclease subunit S [Citrobacter freundii]MCR1296650.1 restriction endonuclease subunit S [Enterobacter kobei]MDH0966163.1 restriction endonuclease subunit S [Klebsiella michiganensis]MEA9442184.1 restriction endonuclease subunit S [Aeromonas caviae]HEE9903056.1 restriction endonuclease subunit S [Citrobacter freundii]
MSENKKQQLVPRLRFPEYRAEDGWGSEFGNMIFDQISNKDHNSDLPVLAITQEQGAIPREMIDYHVSVTDKSLESYKVVEVGDFIISLRSFQGGIEFSRYRGICSPAYVILRLRHGHSEDYFRHYLKTDRFIAQMIKNLEGLRDGKMISYKQFSELELPIPPRDEQQKIADCLSSLDDLITAETQKLDTLKTHKKGLMQQLFPREGETVPGLRFPEFRETGEWEKVSLQRVIEIASGQVDPTKPPYCDLPHVGGENIEAGTGKLLNLRTAKEDGVISGKYAFDEHDILYSKIRPALNKVAAPDISGVCSADVYPIRPCCEMLRREFLVYLLRSESFVKYATKHSGRGKIPKINREDLFAYDAMLPTPAEQEYIASFLSSLDERINLQSQKLEDLQNHKIGLMQQLFPALDEVDA